MNAAAAAALRRAAAHLVIADVECPELDDAAAHHLRVLRVGASDVVTVTDGDGRWRECRVAGAQLVAESPVQVCEPFAQVTIAAAMPKGDRLEWMVQKLVELGVARIVLLHADRSVVRWEPSRADRHRRRLEQLIVEAVQQSRQVWLPKLEGPVAAASVLPGCVVAEPGGRPLALRDTAVAIGPEGGWSDDELGQAVECVSLGSSVLRIETAAISVAAFHAVGRAAT